MAARRQDARNRAQDAILSVRPRNKYGAIRTTRGALTFDSKGEAERWDALCLAERFGAISGLERQVAYVLQDGGRDERIKLTWDYRYSEGGRLVVEDFKGRVTRDFTIRLKLFRRLYPTVAVKLSGRDGVKVLHAA